VCVVSWCEHLNLNRHLLGILSVCLVLPALQIELLTGRDLCVSSSDTGWLLCPDAG
jgi:hypothetical protein